MAGPLVKQQPTTAAVVVPLLDLESVLLPLDLSLMLAGSMTGMLLLLLVHNFTVACESASDALLQAMVTDRSEHVKV